MQIDSIIYNLESNQINSFTSPLIYLIFIKIYQVSEILICKMLLQDNITLISASFKRVLIFLLYVLFSHNNNFKIYNNFLTIKNKDLKN